MKQKLIRFLAFVVLSFPAMAQLTFTPSEWDMGVITKPVPQHQAVVIENKGDTEVKVQILPTCDCSTVEPESLVVAPHSKGTFTLSFDPKDETGQIDKYYIIRTSLPELGKAHFAVKGSIGFAGASPAVPESTPLTESALYAKRIEMSLYHVPGCKTCERFISSTLPALEKEFLTKIILIDKDITDQTVYLEYEAALAALKIPARALPVLIANGVALQGFDEINGGIRNIMTNTPFTPATDGTNENFQQQEIAILPALIAGLFDGFNPCAFSTIVALLTALTLAGRRKREILLMGIVFTLSVFITYYLIGLGLFKTIRMASGFPIVANILQWIIISVLILFAILSFYDYFLIKTGRKEKMILQLPDSFKKRIQTTIKAHARSRAIVASSIVLGILVSIIELGCTGQVYFPFITVYVLGIKKEFFGYILLLFYNIAFILPLIGVFLVSYFGLSSKLLAKALEKHMGLIKILLGLLFIGMAALTIIFWLKG